MTAFEQYLPVMHLIVGFPAKFDVQALMLRLFIKALALLLSVFTIPVLWPVLVLCSAIDFLRDFFHLPKTTKFEMGLVVFMLFMLIFAILCLIVIFMCYTSIGQGVTTWTKIGAWMGYGPAQSFAQFAEICNN